jgi:hypothetical protein
MGKNFLVTEVQLLRLIKNKSMSESLDIEDYDTMDYHDAFIVLFRKWLDKKIGEKSKELPFSFMMKKYGLEFLDDFGETIHREEGYDELNRWEIERLIKRMVEKGKIVLPTLRPQIKFLEKYKRQLEPIIERLELPHYIKLRIEEEKPFTLTVQHLIDYPEFLKSDFQGGVTTSTTLSKLKHYIVNYLGLDIKSPYLGGFEIHKIDPEYVNLKPWVKKTLDKEIKPLIRKLPKGNEISSIKFTPNERNAEMKIAWKSDSRFSGRDDLRKEVRKILSDLGYNNISVQTQ